MICDFCAWGCDITEKFRGICGGRSLREGRIVTSSYGELSAFADDPIEKKPLRHFLPGTRTLSIAMHGCPFDCDFCQNWRIAKNFERHDEITPQEVVSAALCGKYPSISFTYTEPLSWQDYMLSVSDLAKRKGIRTVMVSNGYFSRKTADDVIDLTDAFNIDLKGDAEFYEKYCGGRIGPVLDGLERIIEKGKHLEVTTLVIEGIHNGKMIEELGRELHSIGVKVWHITRFFPARRMSGRTPTGEGFLSEMLEKADESGIPFIYPGNSFKERPTLCPNCGNLTGIGTCSSCGVEIYGVKD